MGTYTFEHQIHCRLVRLGYLAFTQATRVQIPAMEAFCSTFYCFNVFSCFLSECYTQVPITYFNFFSKFSRFLSHATIRNLIHYVTRCTAPFFCHVHVHILSRILNVHNSCKTCIGNAKLQVNWPTGMPDTCGNPQCMKPQHPTSTGDKLRHKLKLCSIFFFLMKQLCTKFHS